MLILHGSNSSEPGGPAWRAEFLNIPYDVDHVISAIYEKGLMEKATGEPVQWPYIDEKYFAEAAAILGIPDYREGIPKDQ